MINEIQQAVVAALRSAPYLHEEGAEVFDHVPQKQMPPYVQVGEAVVQANDSEGVNGITVALRIHAWSNYSGRDRLHKMQMDIYRALHHADFELTEYSDVSCDFSSGESFIDSDGKTRHGIQDFIIRADIN